MNGPLDMLEETVKLLEPLLPELVFVGGAVLPFYLVGVLAVLFRSGRRARALTSASHSFYSSEIAAPGASPLGSLPLGQ